MCYFCMVVIITCVYICNNVVYVCMYMYLCVRVPMCVWLRVAAFWTRLCDPNLVMGGSDLYSL